MTAAGFPLSSPSPSVLPPRCAAAAAAAAAAVKDGDVHVGAGRPEEEGREVRSNN